MTGPRRFPIRLLACALPLLHAVWCCAGASAADSYDSLHAQVADGAVTVHECPDLAATFGEWVAAQRDAEVAGRKLLQGRQLGDDLHAACREGIRRLEQSTGEDEAALEALYRSEQWYDVNGALAALRYWQAWLDLSLAQQDTEKDARVTDLAQARRGFEAASLRILYPGLVYGSWLGLAYVARLEGDEAAMQRRLSLLQQALESDPDNPLREIVDTELELQRLRLNAASPVTIVPGEPLTESGARLAEEKAFALLAQHRRIDTGAIEAAGYLRQLIEQGFLDDRLLARLLSFRDEIAGRNIGPLGLLVDAEYAYAYQQYETDVLKFRQYLAGPAARYPDIDLAVFHYHYAVSLYHIGLLRDALAEIDALRRRSDLPAALRAPLVKLNFIVAEAMYRGHPSPERAARMRSAAAEFIAATPNDPDIASAHMALALVVEDEAEQARQLALAGEDARLGDRVRIARLDVAVGRFRERLADGDLAGAAAPAREALQLLEELPAKQRESLDMQVLALQLHTASGGEEEALLQTFATLYAEPGLTRSQKRVLVWCQLRLLDRSGGSAALQAFVRNLPASGADPAVSDELYLLLRDFDSRGRHADVAGLAGLWLPMLEAQPQLQRQVWLLAIEALRASGRQAEALVQIQAMLAAFPNSGDAWEQLALQSESMGDAFSAERALAHIADAEPEGSPRWLEVSLHRLALLAALEAGESRGCDLYRHIAVYSQRLQDPQRDTLADFARDNDCAGQQEN